ncbi:MAG: trypsin-like peptidase domain-containing protein [Pseudomonadota bacterium]|nr:trypsin-like peptidase domain-containing protein [Pseudomonadota bacterium]
MLAPLLPVLLASAFALTPARPARPGEATGAAAASPVTSPSAAPSGKATDKAGKAGALPADWESTLARVVPSIVAIRVSATRPFDTEGAASAVATGFVVDAERGIILTNRHVVEPGPVVAEAVFYNHEEVPLRALYRDPVHDFGFYQFDPKALRFMQASALPLEPGHAKVGVELRVVGNDAGEKISILQGTLARLDRDAPSYGDGNFNDFDTFYYQAASSTSGGSSGSPVLDVHGHVIALNAGGSNRAASSFYLPLDRVVRALQKVQAGMPVPRGTVESVFRHRPFDEVRRLGLTDATEAAVRAANPDGTGMLVVDQVIPGGPAFGKLEPGDIVVRVEGALTTAFIPWEELVDNRVGGTIAVEIERGGTPVKVTLPVVDLHAVTPSTYLEVGGAVLNPYSLQLARSHTLPLDVGVWLAASGYMFANAGIPDDVVITGIGSERVQTLDALEAALGKQADQARVTVRWIDPREPKREQVSVVTIDRRWFPMQRCTRDDSVGLWPCVTAAAPPAATASAAATGALPEVSGKAAKALAPSLVWVTNNVPFRAEGIYGGNFSGTGLVIDAARGRVLVDRDTVPIALGDVSLTFAGTVRVPAKVEFIHPIHNLAVLSYDPAALGGTPVASARLATKGLEKGDTTFHVGLSPRQEVLEQETKATAEEPMLLSVPRPPFFRDRNLDVVSIERSGPVVGGVLADKQGRVQALWASFVEDRGDKPEGFFRGIPTDVLRDVVDPVVAGTLPTVRSLGLELAPMNLAMARDRGLSNEWAEKLVEADPMRRQVLWVVRREAGTPAAAALREGDLLLAVDGKPVTRFRDVDLHGAKESLTLTLLRDGKEQTVPLATVPRDGEGVDRVLLWAGALLHAPHSPLSSDLGVEPEGIYVSWSWYGSPASRYQLRPTHRILAVDSTPTPTLDAFLAAVANRPDRGPVRLKTVDLDGKPQVITLKLDLQYWPTAELRAGTSGWERVER